MTMVWQSLKNETDMNHEDENLSPSADVLNKTSNLAISDRQTEDRILYLSTVVSSGISIIIN